VIVDGTGSRMCHFSGLILPMLTMFFLRISARDLDYLEVIFLN